MAISRTVARPSFFIPRRVRAGLVIAPLLVVLAVVIVRFLHTPAVPLAPDLPAASPITPGQLTQLLARSTVAPNAVNLEITYAPPIYFQVMGQDASADKARVFLLQEDTHIDALDQSPAPFSLQIDGRGEYLPTSGTILSDSGHHRLSTFFFAQADLPEAHESLKVIFRFANGASSDVTWALPLTLAASSGAVSAATVEEARLPSLNATLRRVQTGVSYAGASNVEVAVTFATPEYFGAALPPEAASRFDPGSTRCSWSQKPATPRTCRAPHRHSCWSIKALPTSRTWSSRLSPRATTGWRWCASRPIHSRVRSLARWTSHYLAGPQ